MNSQEFSYLDDRIDGCRVAMLDSEGKIAGYPTVLVKSETQEKLEYTENESDYLGEVSDGTSIETIMAVENYYCIPTNYGAIYFSTHLFSINNSSNPTYKEKNSQELSNLYCVDKNGVLRKYSKNTLLLDADPNYMHRALRKYNGGLIAILGNNASNSTLIKCREFNPVTREWTYYFNNTINMPEENNHYSYFVYDDKVFALDYSQNGTNKRHLYIINPSGTLTDLGEQSNLLVPGSETYFVNMYPFTVNNNTYIYDKAKIKMYKILKNVSGVYNLYVTNDFDLSCITDNNFFIIDSDDEGIILGSGSHNKIYKLKINDDYEEIPTFPTETGYSFPFSGIQNNSDGRINAYIDKDGVFTVPGANGINSYDSHNKRKMFKYINNEWVAGSGEYYSSWYDKNPRATSLTYRDSPVDGYYYFYDRTDPSDHKIIKMDANTNEIVDTYSVNENVRSAYVRMNDPRVVYYSGYFYMLDCTIPYTQRFSASSYRFSIDGKSSTYVGIISTAVQDAYKVGDSYMTNTTLYVDVLIPKNYSYIGLYLRSGAFHNNTGWAYNSFYYVYNGSTTSRKSFNFLPYLYATDDFEVFGVIGDNKFLATPQQWTASTKSGDSFYHLFSASGVTNVSLPHFPNQSALYNNGILKYKWLSFKDALFVIDPYIYRYSAYLSSDTEIFREDPNTWIQDNFYTRDKSDEITSTITYYAWRFWYYAPYAIQFYEYVFDANNGYKVIHASGTGVTADEYSYYIDSSDNKPTLNPPTHLPLLDFENVEDDEVNRNTAILINAVPYIFV